MTHWKRPWCWEGLGEGGEGDDRGWDGWMASLTRWTWVWVHSGCWWWTGSPGVLQFMGSQRAGHDWATELNWILYCPRDYQGSSATPALKASILQHSAFFMVQLSHPCMTTEKTIALTIWIILGKVISLFFKMLSRVVIAFLPRSNHLSISWLHSQSAVILEPKKIKSVTVSIVSPSICHEVMGPDVRIFNF